MGKQYVMIDGVGREIKQKLLNMEKQSREIKESFVSIGGQSKNIFNRKPDPITIIPNGAYPMSIININNGD
ncbi:MAG: hypothetical protein ACK5JF_10320 [Oscillospiraceae bacterium]